MSVLKKIANFLINGLLYVLAAVGLDSPNRIVVALSPLFVAASGWVAAEFALLLPGLPRLGAGWVLGVFIAASLFTTTKILLWLHGWQLHEARSGSNSTNTGGAGTTVTATPTTGQPSPLHEVGT